MPRLTSEIGTLNDTFAVQAIYVDLRYTRDSPEFTGTMWKPKYSRF